MWRKLVVALIAPWLLSTLAMAAEIPSHTILVWGDSLSAGYGLGAGQGWVALLRQRIARRHLGWRVVNGSVSGEPTTYTSITVH